MNKRQIKKSMEKATFKLENRDNLQTVEYLTGRVAEIEEKCCRYVLEAADLKMANALGAKAYDSVVANWKKAEAKLDVVENDLKTLIEDNAKVKIELKQQKEMKNTFFNSLNKSIESGSKLDKENKMLARNYKLCADKLGLSEDNRRNLKDQCDCLKQRVVELEAEVNKPWWKKVFSWL